MIPNRSPLDRRSFLTTVGRTGVALTAPNILRWGAAIAAPDAALWPVAARAATADTLLQPSEIRSKNGVLEATITAAPGRVELGDYAFPGFLYNGAYMPPVLRARVGDTMRIAFQNNLPDDPSNLHYHGLVVSPQGRGDNVFIHVHPGDDFKYEVRIPGSGRQGPGLFWYHPHAHGVVDKQILGGMSGALVVDGSEQLFPILGDLAERFLLLKHAEVGEDSEIISINGQVEPVVEMRPGEPQFWRIGNIGAEMFFKFRIDGVRLYAVATDGNPLSRPTPVAELFLGPGERIDLIAVAPEPGAYQMRTVSFPNEAWRKPRPPQKLATIVCAGDAEKVGSEAAILGQRVQGARWIDTVRSSAIARRRKMIYSRTPDKRAFMINGRIMDESRIDAVVRLGDTEEWTVVNTDQQYHNFHIHQTAFLVTDINGVPQEQDSLHDTFSV